MRATEGAIEGVVLTDGEVALQVIGGDVEPRGICGSGLIDIVAQLRLVGLLDERRQDADARGTPRPPAIRSPATS